jgi:hypothetical protein
MLKGGNIFHEALPTHRGIKGKLFFKGIHCYTVLNAILHRNIELLEYLLKETHSLSSIIPYLVYETRSRFRRILAISLSIFQAKALGIILDHMQSHNEYKLLDLTNIKV